MCISTAVPHSTLRKVASKNYVCGVTIPPPLPRHPESREEVRQLLTQPPDLDSVLDGMEVSSIRLALRDAALLASVDGDYDESELEALRKICDAAGLSKKDLAKILDWVSDFWKMGANGRAIISLPMPGDENII